MNIVEKAIQIAVSAHKDQVRKSDGTPYIVHPLMVARILDKYGFDDVIIAAAVTHDVLEDTPVTKAQFRTELGGEVLKIVESVSEHKSLKWEDRKAAYIETVKQGGEGTKAVSVADKIHNLGSLIDGYNKQGPAIWKKFNRGKAKKMWFERSLYNALKETWSHPLLNEYERLLLIVEKFDE